MRINMGWMERTFSNQLRIFALLLFLYADSTFSFSMSSLNNQVPFSQLVCRKHKCSYRGGNNWGRFRCRGSHGDGDGADDLYINRFRSSLTSEEVYIGGTSSGSNQDTTRRRQCNLQMVSAGKRSHKDKSKGTGKLPTTFNIANTKRDNTRSQGSTDFNSDLIPGHQFSSTHGATSTASNHRLNADSLRPSLKTFVAGLQSRSKDSNVELSYNEREDLYVLLATHVNKRMKPSSLTSIVSSMNVLKQNSKSWDCTKELRLLASNMPSDGSNGNSYTAQDVSTIFVTFAKMQARYDQTLEKSEDLLLATSRLMYKMNSRSVGNIIWGLGSMGATWKSIPLELRDAITAAISRHATSFSSFTLPSILWALSKMGVKWSAIPDDARTVFPSRLEELVDEMSPQQSSKVIWSLGCLGATHDYLPKTLLSSYLDNVNKIKKSQMGSAVPASQSLTGMAKTGIHWSSLTLSMRHNIWEQVERVVQSNNDRGTANAVWALGSLGSPFSEQPRAVRDALFQGSTRVAGTCSSWAFCNMLWGFARMEYMWSDFPSKLKEAIKENIGRLEPEMNAIDVSILTWSLGSLAVPLDSSPREHEAGAGRQGVEGRILGPLFDAILRTLPDMRSHDISSLIWGLSGTSISWDSLPQTLRWSINVALRRVSETMSPQDVANCAYGLTLLSFDTTNPMDPGFRGAHDALVNKLQTISRTPTSNIELEQLRIFAHFYETFKIGVSNDVIRGTRVPRMLLEVESAEVSIINREGRGSNLQDRVIEGLQAAFIAMEGDNNPYVKDIIIDPEISSFGGILPVDALVIIDNKYKVNKNDVLAILEIDGPQHYREDGTLRRVDLLKEFMYLKRHPKAIFCRVRWDEANKIGVDAIGNSLACQILQIAETNKNPLSGIGKALNNVLEETQKAFVWGMRNDNEKSK